MLTEAALITLLEPFADRLSPAFVAFPDTHQTAAAMWASAATQWVQPITPPSPNSPGAYAAFYDEMLRCTVGGERAAFARAWHKLALVLAPGMVGWAAVPPAAPPDFEPVYDLGVNQQGSNQQCLQKLAEIVLAWLRTGTATQLSTNLTINWS
jgi:hypothetical protein